MAVHHQVLHPAVHHLHRARYQQTELRFLSLTKNSGSNTFDDPVAKAIEEKTGVKIQVENPTGDPLEKLNLMLTGQNYPDIVLMDRGNDIVNRYIEAGALLPLNDLIDEYGPDVKRDVRGNLKQESLYRWKKLLSE